MNERLTREERRNLEDIEDALQEAFKHAELVVSDLDEIGENNTCIDDYIFGTAEDLLEKIAKNLEEVQSRIGYDDRLEMESIMRDSYRY